MHEGKRCSKKWNEFVTLPKLFLHFEKVEVAIYGLRFRTWSVQISHVKRLLRHWIVTEKNLKSKERSVSKLSI